MRPWVLQTERGEIVLTRIGAAWYAPARLRLPAWLEVRRAFGRGYTLRVLLGEHVEAVAYDPQARALALVDGVPLLDRDVAAAACRVLELARVQLLPARDKPAQPEQIQGAAERPATPGEERRARAVARVARVRASRKKVTFADREAGRRTFQALGVIGDAVARGVVLETLRHATGPDVPALRGAIERAVPGTCSVVCDRAVCWPAADGSRNLLVLGAVQRVTGWRAMSAVGDPGTWIEGSLERTDPGE